MIQNLSIAVDVPAGYEATGEYRKPVHGEHFLTASGTAKTCHSHDHCGLSNFRIILRKQWALPFWFPAGWWLWVHQPYGDWCVSESPSWSSSRLCAYMLWRFHGETFVPPKVEQVRA